MEEDSESRDAHSDPRRRRGTRGHPDAAAAPDHALGVCQRISEDRATQAERNGVCWSERERGDDAGGDGERVDQRANPKFSKPKLVSMTALRKRGPNGGIV